MKTSQDFITEMSKSEIRELESRLSVIVEHLLKVRHVEGQIGLDNLRGWKNSVRISMRTTRGFHSHGPGNCPLMKLLEELWL